MKLSVKTDDIQRKLSFLNHAISTRSQMPILLHFLLEAKQESLHISATDLEIGIHTIIPATIMEEGETTVPAKTFSELLNSLSVPAVTFETTENALTITSEKTKNVLQTMSTAEYPVLSKEKETHVATLPKETFYKQLATIIFAASIDTGRPALSGVYIKKETQGFLLVATDGYRLSLKHYAIGEEREVSEDEKPLIIPARVFKEAASIKDEGEELTLDIAPQQNQIIVTQGKTTLIGRLIDAQFPPYERIIPVDKASTIQFDREELLKAVKICAIFAREGANIIKFSLTKESIIVSANSSSGENTVRVDAKLIGEENEIAFNAKYLVDVLATLDNQELSFEMTGPLNPGVFKIPGDETFLHLIMPIRVQA